MPAKRKRTGPHPAPPAPRRSTRNQIKEKPTENGDGNANGTTNGNGHVNGLQNGFSHFPPPIELKKEDSTQTIPICNNELDVEEAVRELTEMEHRLQTAVRKQRLAIESSDLGLENGERDRNEPDLRPLPRDPGKDILYQRPSRINPPLRALEEAPMDEPDATLAMDDMVDAAYEDETVDRGGARPPAVNSSILPLPWTGRLGYACLNTYLRNANPPVFSSRTCRLSSIIDHRHPLQDPSQPEHPTKNRPDKFKPADVKLGQQFLYNLGLANARDIVKMLRWNDKYGIKFMRLSSEMFPFASHGEHGYKLEPFASEVLAEAGKVAAELGHRLTTHPGQFTQIASPRKEVVTAAMRDLEYHNELLSLLKLPEQSDRDAIMIMHMGGTYGDKEATLNRFRENYPKLSLGVKKRLVLENDDVAWSVHDLLPVCEELNIPLVLDFHHHNIIFDPCIREGTHDIISLFDRIKATWTKKNIRQKMHYSEPTAPAVSGRERRKHSPRVKTLPPCDPDMDLMIEAKDKEQAVFELMRTFRLPGWDTFNSIVPFERQDEIRNAGKKTPKKTKKTKNGADQNGTDEDDQPEQKTISDADFGMGGPDNRVYWPEGMEEWLRPKKREVKKATTKPAKN